MITIFYDSTCILCTTNAIEMQAKKPDAIGIIPVDNAIDELAKAKITKVQAMTYICVKDSTGNIQKSMDAVRLQCEVANIRKFGIRLSWLLGLPIIKQVCYVAYPIIARNRYYFPRWAIRLIYGKVVEASLDSCGADGVCRIPPKQRV